MEGCLYVCKGYEKIDCRGGQCLHLSQGFHSLVVWVVGNKQYQNGLLVTLTESNADKLWGKQG